MSRINGGQAMSKKKKRQDAAKAALAKALRRDRKKNPQDRFGDIVKPNAAAGPLSLGAGGIGMTPSERERVRKALGVKL